MRKLMAVAAMLAMMLVAASPAMADEIEIEGDDGVFFTSEVEDFDGDDFEDFFDEVEDEGIFFISSDFDEDDFEDFDEDDFDEVDFFSFDSVDSDFDEVEFEF
ncbi:MAG: hypothetical protein H0T57_06800 [Rubrobacter sp.]|jgi:hypothetical protein|nr:hypothetical protein [Rubrobacter sp.]